MSDDPKQSSDGPTLATLVVLGFFMGILIALILLGRNKEFLSALAMTALALIVLCGGRQEYRLCTLGCRIFPALSQRIPYIKYVSKDV